MAELFGVNINYFFKNKQPNSEDKKAAETIAAHINNDVPESERKQIINFIENLKKTQKC